MNTFFDIIKLTAEFAKKYSDAPPAPHRHNYEEIILVTAGNPSHFIDFNKEVVAAPAAMYVAQGKIHQFLPDEDTRGWAVRYNPEFIPDTRFRFYSNFKDNIHFALDSAECVKNMETLCDMMARECQQATVDYVIIKHLLSAVLAKLESEEKKQVHETLDLRNPDLAAFNNFLQILDHNYKRAEDVQFYADKMNTSVRNLNRISHMMFEKSVSEIIETRKLIEARQLLLNTGKTISEIGFELGYNEKSYFTRVFHKKTGLTPSEFRAQMRSVLS